MLTIPIIMRRSFEFDVGKSGCHKDNVNMLMCIEGV